MTKLRRIAVLVLPPLVVFGAVMGAWYFTSYVVLDETEKFLLPPPHEVVSDAFFESEIRADILDATWVSAKVAAIGLAVAIGIGFVTAIAMSRAKWIERSLYPWVILLQTVPILAIVPVIGFWFGFNLFPRVVVVVIIALFPLIINTLQGLQSPDPGLHDLFTLARSGGARRRADHARAGAHARGHLRPPASRGLEDPRAHGAAPRPHLRCGERHRR